MKRILLALVLLLVGSTASADFVTSNTPLPANKINLNPLPPGANPALYFTATDYNNLAQAATDLRTYVLRITPQLMTAAFSAVDNVALTWNNVGGTQYVLVSTPVVTDGAGGVAFFLTNMTSTGATLNASAPWTGTVAVAVISF